MIRNLKTLGLAVVAVLAMSAVIASAAQAGEFTATTGNYPVTVTATQVGTHEFTLNGRTLTCTSAKFAGTASAKSKSITVTPSYETCHTIVFGSTWPVTVTVGTCDYLLESTPTPQVKVVCPSGNIDIHIYESHAAHTAGTSVCTYHVGPQTIGGVTYTNTGSGDTSTVDITTTSNVAVKRTSGSTLLCGSESQTAVYHSTTEATGTFNGVHEGLDVG